MIKISKVNKKEFILALAIITFCVTLWTMIKPPIINTTLVVRIEPIYEIKCNTSNEGDVNCYVKK